MEKAPKWFVPVAVIALLWNLLGCAAYLVDVMRTPEAIAALSPAEQAMYAARPMWSVAATAVAVWFGAAGCVGLILRGRWAYPLLLASLVGVIAQDISLFVLVPPEGGIAASAFIVQGLVLLVAVGLVMMASKANARGWAATAS